MRLNSKQVSLVSWTENSLAAKDASSKNSPLSCSTRESGSIGLPSLLAGFRCRADVRFTQHPGDRHGPIRFAAYAHGATALCGRSTRLHGVSPDSGDGGTVGALGVAGRTPSRSRWASTICSISARCASWSRRCISGHWSCSVDPLAMADHKEATTRLLVERNCRSSCDRRVAISSRLALLRRRAEHVGEQSLQRNAGRFSDGFGVIPGDPLPLADSLRRHAAYPCDLCGATQFFDRDRVHGRDSKPRLLFKSSTTYVEMCKLFLQNCAHDY